MSKPQPPENAALLVAMMIAKGFDPELPEGPLRERFGTIQLRSPIFPWDFSRYYDKEMGPGINRRFLLFQELVPQGDLADIKLWTNELESKYAEGGSRKVNLDPGILTPNRFVLATGKDNPSRIYLRDGIFADLTLMWQSGGFIFHPWTYPDFRDERTLDFLTEARNYYLFKRKHGQSTI